MGFLRKSLILGTGGLAPVKSRSYRERTARATEKLAKLQEQQMVGGAVAPSGLSASSEAATPVRPWLVVYQYGDNQHQVDHVMGVASGFDTEARARQRAGRKKRIKTPSGRMEVTGVNVIKADPNGSWQLLYDLDNGHTVRGNRFTSKQDAVLVGKGAWKAQDPSKSFRTIQRWRVEPVGSTPRVESAPPAGVPPPDVAPGSDPVEQLRKLAALRDSGVLTDAEFEAKKADLLDRI